MLLEAGVGCEQNCERGWVSGAGSHHGGSLGGPNRGTTERQVEQPSWRCKNSSHEWVKYENLNYSEGSATMIRQKEVVGDCKESLKLEFIEWAVLLQSLLIKRNLHSWWEEIKCRNFAFSFKLERKKKSLHVCFQALSIFCFAKGRDLNILLVQIMLLFWRNQSNFFVMQKYNGDKLQTWRFCEAL